MQQQLSDQEDALLGISMPVVPLLDDAVIVPVTGQLTLAKARHIQQHVILQVHSMPGVNTVIMDFSGVTAILSHSEDALEKVYRSFKLLGIKTILTGVTPALSQKLVHSGTTVRVDRIYSTLKMAVSDLIKARG
ncbi:STAS domain-containing protein [Planococcus sp. ISL-109]|uniref:STAS domain-containing protein n=1 Tax=Planococcus sp. ISL-109 TaxID=2819166 RepID=UPI001BE5F5A1|nr:STAS domain-containing protein [Planococcus sp. ISL-109]MBT2583449.1 STAS domain-containing protein [Planococcus sp. ISL-109]